MSETKDKYYIPGELDVGNSVSDVLVCASKVIFEKNGFVIFSCGSFSVKGNFSGTVVPGLDYKVSGKISLYGKFPQIAASSIELVEDGRSDEAVIASFIKANFTGVGEKTGAAIASKFGKGFLEELLKRPKSAAKSIAGLSEKRALTMSKKIDEEGKRLSDILDLRLIGLSEDQAAKAYDAFGVTAAEEIKNNPYKLLRIEGIGFETCEYLASKYDIDLFDPLRILGAISCVLNEEHYSSGNTYVVPNELEKDVRNLLFGDSGRMCDKCVDMNNCTRFDPDCRYFPKAYGEALKLGVTLDEIVIFRFADGKCMGCDISDPDARVAGKKVFRTEAKLKSEISSFLFAKKPPFDRERAIEVIKELSAEKDITLDELQTEAVLMCLREPFSIITGGPGTGKTTITGILAAHFKRKNIKCLFCAPTGRAAKRLSEAVGQEANTIHRLLEVRPKGNEEGFIFGRNAENPLEARVIVVDESSMVDNALFMALLSAVRSDSSIILIGDPNQLPSVGPGNLLADLLSCSLIPRTELKYVFRQADESSIAANAYRILKGERLIGNNDDFVIIDTKSEEEAMDKVFELYSRFEKEDMAILSPTKQNVLGTGNLNRELQTVAADLTLPSTASPGGGIWRVTDRVMQIKNDYDIEFYNASTSEVDTGVYNGELGKITKIDTIDKVVTVVFDDGKKVEYKGKALSDIDLSYAMTVHKAQGCEFDDVVLVLGRMSSKLYSRKLLYTAVTRGKKKVVIIDHQGCLGKMLRAGDTHLRLTSLKDFLAIIENKRRPR